MSTPKLAGFPCPKCGSSHCAEYAQINQSAKWTCNGCGATGPLVGSLSIRPPAAPAPTQPPKRGPEGLTKQFPAPESSGFVSSLGAVSGPPA